MIDRRSLLSWVGISVSGALGARSGSAAARRQTGGVIALESFHVANAEQLPDLHEYLSGVAVHAPGIHLEALVAPKSPQALLLTGFSSFDEMLAARERIAADRAIQNRRAELESAGVLLEVQSRILTGAVDSAGRKAGIFEIRSYHCPAWENQPPAEVAAIFRRARIHPMVNAASAAGEHVPQLTYVIPFDSLAAREEAWSRLAADPDWIAMERESALKVTSKSIYKPAPGSRLA